MSQTTNLSLAALPSALWFDSSQIKVERPTSVTRLGPMALPMRQYGEFLHPFVIKLNRPLRAHHMVAPTRTVFPFSRVRP